MRSPFCARSSGGRSGIAIGSEVTWHLVNGRTGFVREGHEKVVISEWVRLVVSLVRKWAIECQRDIVPLHQVSGNRDASRAIR